MREIVKYKIPTYPYFYSQNMIAPSLQYDEVPIIGEWLLDFKRDDISEAVADDNTFLNPGKKYFSLLLKDDEVFVNHLLELSSKVIETANKFEALSYKDHKENTVSELGSFYPEYIKYFVPIFAFGYCLDFFLDIYIKENSIDISKIKPCGASFISKEKNELSNIFKESSEEKFELLLKEHSYKYNWILNNYTGEKILDIHYFKSRKEEIVNFKQTEIIPITHPKNLEEWISYLTHIRDERKRLNLITIGLMDRYLKKKCSENNLDYSNTVMLTVPEFETILKKGKDIPEKKERYMKSSFAGPVDIKKSEFEAFAKEDVDFHGELKGTIASKGIARGVVKIILSSDDFHKIQKGDVIVASMTRPEFAPILGQCAAIITNEGGITCHAAIVSRELNIPCIIGTKIATKVFRDGDVVEVDAEKGTIKISNV